MAKLSIFCTVLAFAAVAVLFLLAKHSDAEPVCEDNSWDQLKANCTEFVKIDKPPTLPSPQCCRTIKNANLPCACNDVTPELEKNISIPLAIMMASFCGHPMPPGTKCGSITVPYARCDQRK